MTASEAIAWAVERFHPDLRFAVSFQKTSSVMVDMAHRIEPEARFFYVDTGLLFPETYETRDALAGRYGVEFERFADGPVAAQARSAPLTSGASTRMPAALTARSS